MESLSVTFQTRYIVSRSIAFIFKVFVILWVIAGIYVFVKITSISNMDSGGTSPISMRVAVVAGTILGAAFLGFFAYVLDLLCGTWEATSGEYEVPENNGDGASGNQGTFTKVRETLY
jgi:hypothetical protein